MEGTICNGIVFCSGESKTLSRASGIRTTSHAGHAQQRGPGVAKSGSRAGHDETSGIVYSPRQFISMFYCISIQTRSFLGLFTPKNDWFCMEKQWNTEMRGWRSLKWRHGHICWAWPKGTLKLLKFCGENVMELNFFFFLNTLLCILENRNKFFGYCMHPPVCTL